MKKQNGARETPILIEPPSHLSPRAQELWRGIVPRRAKSPERQALLTIALEALTRSEGAAKLIEIEGLTSVTPTTGAIHLHPLVKVERESRALFAKIWGQLHFEWWQPVDGSGDDDDL